VSRTPDDFVGALRLLAAAGVPFVIAGVGGINFYARSPAEVVATADLDLLLAPRSEALRSALAALSRGGFEFFAGDEPFLDLADAPVLEGVVRSGGCITARHASGIAIDLMLAASGLSWSEAASDAIPFRLGDLEVRVAKLERLLRSKEIAGRPKDLEFLRLFAARLRDEDG
jgi:hypothetical protein